MEKVKVQHYVPRSYLRRFSSDGEQIWTFDKYRGVSFRTNVKNVAAEGYFYDFPPDLVDELMRTPEFRGEFDRELGGALSVDTFREIVTGQPIEQFLSLVESEFSRVIDNLLSELSARRKDTFKRKFIFRRERFSLALCASVQIVRTKEFRQMYMELGNALGTDLLRRNLRISHPELDPEDYTVAQDERIAPVMHAKFLLSPDMMQEFVRALSRHVWLLGINETGVPFLTSDTPVVRHPHIHHPLKGTNGYASPGIEVAFPLTPKLILIMCDRQYFAHLASKDGRAISLDKDNVLYYNSLQTRESARQIFSLTDEFSLVKDVCRKTPEICSPDRKRFEIK